MSVEKDLTQRLLDLYAQKDFTTFIDELLKAKEAFPESMFHYNLGSAYAKIENFSVAKYHLEKSIKLGSLEPKIFNNLNYVNQKLNVYDLDTSQSLIDRAYGLLLMIPWEGVFILLSLLALIMMIKKDLRAPKRGIPILLSPFILTFFFYLYSSNKNYAVTFEAAELREGPSEVFDVSNRIPSGAKVLLTDYQNGWFLVDRPKEYYGWIKKTDIGIY